MNITRHDIEKLIDYSDQYIAYAGDQLKVLASGKTMLELEKKLIDKKIEDATITYIPPVNRTFSPLCL